MKKRLLLSCFPALTLALPLEARCILHFNTEDMKAIKGTYLKHLPTDIKKASHDYNPGRHSSANHPSLEDDAQSLPLSEHEVDSNKEDDSISNHSQPQLTDKGAQHTEKKTGAPLGSSPKEDQGTFDNVQDNKSSAVGTDIPRVYKIEDFLASNFQHTTAPQRDQLHTIRDYLQKIQQSPHLKERANTHLEALELNIKSINFRDKNKNIESIEKSLREILSPLPSDPGAQEGDKASLNQSAKIENPHPDAQDESPLPHNTEKERSENNNIIPKNISPSGPREDACEDDAQSLPLSELDFEGDHEVGTNPYSDAAVNGNTYQKIISLPDPHVEGDDSMSNHFPLQSIDKDVQHTGQETESPMGLSPDEDLPPSEQQIKTNEHRQDTPIKLSPAVEGRLSEKRDKSSKNINENRASEEEAPSTPKKNKDANISNSPHVSPIKMENQTTHTIGGKGRKLDFATAHGDDPLMSKDLQALQANNNVTIIEGDFSASFMDSIYSPPYINGDKPTSFGSPTEDQNHKKIENPTPESPLCSGSETSPTSSSEAEDTSEEKFPRASANSPIEQETFSPTNSVIPSEIEKNLSARNAASEGIDLSRLPIFNEIRKELNKKLSDAVEDPALDKVMEAWGNIENIVTSSVVIAPNNKTVNALTALKTSIIKRDSTLKDMISAMEKLTQVLLSPETSYSSEEDRETRKPFGTSPMSLEEDTSEAPLAPPEELSSLTQDEKDQIFAIFETLNNQISWANLSKNLAPFLTPNYVPLLKDLLREADKPKLKNILNQHYGLNNSGYLTDDSIKYFGKIFLEKLQNLAKGHSKPLGHIVSDNAMINKDSLLNCAEIFKEALEAEIIEAFEKSERQTVSFVYSTALKEKPQQDTSSIQNMSAVDQLQAAQTCTHIVLITIQRNGQVAIINSTDKDYSQEVKQIVELLNNSEKTKSLLVSNTPSANSFFQLLEKKGVTNKPGMINTQLQFTPYYEIDGAICGVHALAFALEIAKHDSIEGVSKLYNKFYDNKIGSWEDIINGTASKVDVPIFNLLRHQMREMIPAYKLLEENGEPLFYTPSKSQRVTHENKRQPRKISF